MHRQAGANYTGRYKTGRHVDEQTNRYASLKTEGRMDRQTNQPTVKEADRQTNRQTDTKYSQIYRQTELWRKTRIDV